MDRAISHLKQSRDTCLKTIEGLSEDQLYKIPNGFNNSIAWNVGHLVVTQQLLHYKLSGLEMKVSDELVALFRKGSMAMPEYSKEIWLEILALFSVLPNQLELDWNSNKFESYKEYTTSFGVKLSSIEDAIAFNNIHEGMHFGYILALKRLV